MSERGSACRLLGLSLCATKFLQLLIHYLETSEPCTTGSGQSGPAYAQKEAKTPETRNERARERMQAPRALPMRNQVPPAPNSLPRDIRTMHNWVGSERACIRSKRSKNARNPK